MLMKNAMETMENNTCYYYICMCVCVYIYIYRHLNSLFNLAQIRYRQNYNGFI